MKAANRSGTVIKMTDTKRRKPYKAIVTLDWVINPETGRAVQKRKCIGYFESQTAARKALLEYNESPYNIDASKLTFRDVYEKWSDEHFPKVSDSAVKGYHAAYSLCSSISRMKFIDIKLDDLQYVIDASGKNTPTLKKLKGMFGQMYDWAVIHDVVTPDRDKTPYLDVTKAGNPNKIDREPFTHAEIEQLWKLAERNKYATIPLMMIYSGVRVSELLDLKKANVNLEERWFDVTASKTAAGIRKVPINDKVYPFFERWYNDSKISYLLYSLQGKHFSYATFYNSNNSPWNKIMEEINATHKPHDTRHTCATLLTAAGVDKRLINRIIGHEGESLAERVYTHLEIETLRDAINKI